MTTYLIISFIALTIGFFIGRFSKVDILDLEKQTQEMEELTEQLTKVTEDFDVSALTEMQINQTLNAIIKLKKTTIAIGANLDSKNDIIYNDKCN